LQIISLPHKNLGTTTKITTIPMTSKPNVIVVQKTTGKGTTIQGLPGKNVVTTLLNAGVSKSFKSQIDCQVAGCVVAAAFILLKSLLKANCA